VRIQKGVQSGEKAKADAKVSARQRTRLAKAQNKQSRKVARQKQDLQKKAPAT
jgi:hypothetical protein